MNRIAVIDLGTNTFNAVVAEQTPYGFHNLYNHKIGVKLGEGGINQGIILDTPFWRGIDAIEKLLYEINRYNPDHIFAIATSAVRSAANGNTFVETIFNLFRLKVQVISGNKEAEYIYHGVSVALPLKKTTSLIMDIGGGSTEFIIANEDGIRWKKSYPLGVARMLELFNPEEPISLNSQMRIQKFLTDELVELDEAVAFYKPDELIGSSGSFDTLAELQCHRLYNRPFNELETTYNFDLIDLQQIHKLLLQSDKYQRLAMPGMESMRVDMIVLADIFVWFVLNRYHFKNMRLSTYSLKEGVLKQLFNNVKI